VNTYVPDQRHDMNGVRVFECAQKGALLRTAKDVIAQIEISGIYKTDLIAIPTARLGDDFFRLETRIAGEVLQKFLQYRHRVAIVGDISQHLAASSALRSFVIESNRGRDICFVANIDELRARLESAS
jgi:uncharacterized protein DUF4180